MKIPILSMSGGGMKGMVENAVAEEIERRSGKSITSIFQLMFGTSAGGINVLSYCAGHSAADTSEFYQQDGPNIFNPNILKKGWNEAVSKGGYKYSPVALESALQKRMGMTRSLAVSPTKAAVTSYDRNMRSAFFFKSHSIDTGKYMMWQAARATSAAELFFPPFELNGMSLWDGGTVANSPTICAYAEACKLWGRDADIKILSLGCGFLAPFKSPPNPGAIQTGKELAGALTGSSDELSSYQAKQILDDSYFEIEPLPMDISMDDASSEGLYYLNKVAAQTIKANSKVIDAFLSA